MSQDQLFERHAAVESQRARTQSTYGARGNFDDPGTLAINSELGVDRTASQPHRANCRLRRLRDLRLYFVRQSRWSHINRFFKEWSVERIRLIEDREHSQLTVCDQSF